MILPQSSTISSVQNKDYSIISPVDLQTRAIDLACRLGSLGPFLEAAHELLTCDKLSSSDFRKHGRKMISLIEIARGTLNRAGLKLYHFTSCSPSFAPHKAVYFEMLRVLAGRRHCIDAELQGRISSLLLPLSSRFIVQRAEGFPLDCRSYATCPEPMRRISPHGGSTPEVPASRFPAHRHNISTPLLMPPPDVFPIAALRKHSGPKRSSSLGHRLWSPDQVRPRRRKSALIPAAEQENVIPPPLALRPLSRRFGIFCTGKSSMHRPREPVGRSMSVRHFGKE